MKKSKKFRLPDDNFHIQDNLFAPPGVAEEVDSPFPPTYTDIEGFEKVLYDPSVAEGLGLDLEFSTSTGKPSILGIANRHSAAAVRWDPILAQACVDRAVSLGTKIVGHSVVGADRPILDGALGRTTPLELWSDTLISHFLCNPDLCLRRDTRVRLWDGGGEAIGDIVNRKMSPQVQSVAPNGSIVPGTITAWYRSERNGRKFVGVGYEHITGGGKRSIVTEDHPVLLETGWKPAGQCAHGDRIHTGTMGLHPSRLGYLCGIFLGDCMQGSSLGITHSEKQYGYLCLKHQIFGSAKRKIGKNTKEGYDPQYVAWVGQTPFMAAMRTAYRTNWLQFVAQHLDAMSFLIWYLDDGCFKKAPHRSASISVDSLTDDEIVFLVDLLKQKLGIDATWSRPDGGATIRVSRIQLNKFFETYAPAVPDCVLYKIPEHLRTRTFDPSFWEPLEVPFYDAITLDLDVRPRLACHNKPEDEKVFCVDVEPYHNFVTAGGVVHNCKTPSKEEDESDGGGAGAMGFMNLWAMSSLYTDLPNWKACRGKACVGPCPLHSPFEYCAIDSWAGLECKFGTFAEMAQKKIPEKLHWDLMVLSEICDKMERRGIKVDKAYVDDLEKNFEVHKESIFPPDTAPFNPRSPKQVMAYFSSQGIALNGTDKVAIKKALDKECKRRGLSIDELDSAPSLPESLEWLYKTFQFKDSGKGLSSWFNDKYVHKDGLIHPRFIVPGSSMGRLSSSGPNLMNVPSKGFGVKVRQALIPRDPSLEFLSADYSQLEMRVMLHYGGYDLKDLAGDPFAGLVERSKGSFKVAADFLHGKERDIAKKLVHANSYGEGMVHLTGKDLERRKKEIDCGALLVYKDWEYRGGVMGFTGANLAEYLFGNKTYESRKQALALQELVNEEYPWVRKLHRKISTQIEERQGIQLETGRFLPLYGAPDEDFKMGSAAIGQGAGADYVQSVMLRYWRELGLYPVLQIHDDLVWEIPAEWSDKKAWEFLQIMREPTDRMEGFWCAIAAKRGKTWGTMRKLVVD